MSIDSNCAGMSYTIEITLQEEKLLHIDNSLVPVMLKVEIPVRYYTLPWRNFFCAPRDI